MNISHPHVYEINTVVWLNELSQKHGEPVTLGKVPREEWDQLRELGFDYVWLMGVWKRSRIGRRLAREAPELRPAYDFALPDWRLEDVVGSPYSIEAYRPDPLVGDWADLETARRQLSRRHMGLILDCVPNHTGADHAWVRRAPDYYLQGTKEQYEANPDLFTAVTRGEQTIYFARGKDPHFPPWRDTLQLNYFNPRTRQAVIRQLKALSHHCDGLRCDMAMLLLSDIFARTWGGILTDPQPEREFWAEAISAVPGLFWMAEAYWDTEWRLQQLGFDYVYDKRLYDRLRQSPPAETALHLKADLDFQNKLVRFIENHDEPRSAAEFGRLKLQAAAILVSTLPGLRLFHQGQLEGMKIRLPVQLARSRQEPSDRETVAFYRRLLQITSVKHFHSGRWQLREVASAGDSSHLSLVAYTWRLDRELKLIVINLSPAWSQGRISLEGEVAPDKKYHLVDELNGQKYVRNSNEIIHPGLHVLLDRYNSHLFNVTLG